MFYPISAHSITPLHPHQIYVMTGGESWVSESVQEGFLTCPTLDIISLHAYSPGDYNTTYLETYVQQARAANKKLIMEEWSVFPAAGLLPLTEMALSGVRATMTRSTTTVPTAMLSRLPLATPTSRLGHRKSLRLEYLGYIGR